MLKMWIDTCTFALPNEVKLYNGEVVRVILYVKDYMLDSYEDEWFEDEFVKSIVKDIDKSEIQGQCVISPVLGSISIRDISAGAMTVIALDKATNLDGEEYMLYMGSCGDNCVGKIEEIAKKKDVMVFLPYMLKFSEDIKAVCLNDGSMINNYDEYLRKFVQFNR